MYIKILEVKGCVKRRELKPRCNDLTHIYSVASIYQEAWNNVGVMQTFSCPHRTNNLMGETEMSSAGGSILFQQ